MRAVKTSLAVALIGCAGFCVIQRLPECFGSRETALAAAAFTLTDGVYRAQAGTEAPTAAPKAIQTQSDAVAPTTAPQPSAESRDKSGYYDSYAPHSGETRYAVAEKTVGADGTLVGSAYVKNSTGLDFDFTSLLQAPLTFSKPQVLIYHTHTSEAYLDEDVDYFYESFYSRTQDENFSVVGVGNALAAALEKNGVSVIHDKTVHDSTYNGSYDRSAETVYADMAEHPDIQIVLDIHRDALGTEDCKVKTVFEHDGKKAAQIMILAGCDCYGERGFDHWQENLSFALKLQNTAETLYPGITRPMSFDFFAYNEYICNGSLLIEIGTDANSIDEAERAATYLGEALAAVIQ